MILIKGSFIRFNTYFQKDLLRQPMRQLNKELFLADLYECIVMHITKNVDRNAEDFVDNTTHP